MKVIHYISNFIKKETVLFAALVLAAISCFFVPPDSHYIGYIDSRTLAILFCLMAVMAGLRKIGVFDTFARRLLERVKSFKAVVFILWVLCFVFSMFITNDVALITFVPLTVVILRMLGEKVRDKWLIPIVTMQTIAANLGSMLTPIGNPQNLYLYGKANMDIGDFLLIMLPYSVLAFALLAVWNVILCRKEKSAPTVDFGERKPLSDKKKLIGYIALFVVCLMTVAHIVPYYATLALTALYLLIFDRAVFKKVDYSLLFTFVGFFVFVGNMGRIDVFRDFIESVISGNEIAATVISSQVISNVPAALLLSGFTENLRALIIGTNIGGLGTLIASMASLISYKYVCGENKSAKLKYLGFFTAANIGFLGFMALLSLFMP
ncbi:MAG: citrate transporter [Oscillospiraceae bacterium]|nr:citrate transporter [Oscillospiraceae bacterium]